jgi:hypothetical protein
MIRQGTKRRHFAHHNAAGSERCVEVSIHSAAIQVLLDHSYLTVPAKFVRVTGRTKSGKSLELSRELTPSRIVRFDKCLPEVTMTGADGSVIRPDVIGYRGDRQMLIEMYFTHAVDAEKQRKIEAHGHAAVEIDLANLDLDRGLESVRKRVIEESRYKEWLYVPREDEVRAELEAELALQIKALNTQYEQAQEEMRRKLEAQRAREEQRKQAEDEIRLRLLAQANPEQRAYRRMSVEDREQQIRRALGLTGPWPRYLHLYNKHNYAIDAPCQLWQAAAFHRFIYKKPILTTTLFVTDVTEWVVAWFGVAPGSGRTASIAVRGWLEYLKGCKFLKKVRSVEGKEAFILMHNELRPADHTHGNGPTLTHGHSAYRNVIRHFEQSLPWKADWPDHDAVRRAILADDDAPQIVQQKLLDWLFTHRQQYPTPMDFAISMQGNDLRLVEILEFLREHRFVE